MDNNAKLMDNANIEIRKIKTKSEKEILKVTTSAKKAVKKAEDTSFTRSIKARESIRAERLTASQKMASAVSEGKLKKQASEVEASKLSEKLRQATDRASAAMRMANIAVMRKEEAERGSLQATERRIEAQYRSTIESLEGQLKTSKKSYDNLRFEVNSKDKKIKDLNDTIQVRLCLITFIFFCQFVLTYLFTVSSISVPTYSS